MWSAGSIGPRASSTRALSLSVTTLVALGLLALSSGCTHRDLPYDWGAKLAHPTMTPDPIAIGPDRRVRAVSEGATGDLGSPSCGCD